MLPACAVAYPVVVMLIDDLSSFFQGADIVEFKAIIAHRSYLSM
jgi:hypothetical protein